MKFRLAGLALVAAAFTTPSLIKFTANGGTSRTLASKLGDTVSVLDFGAKCDGSTDDTTAFQNGINAVGAGGFGATLLVPTAPLGCVISATLNVASLGGFRMRGVGRSSKLLWSGNASGPMLYVSSTRESIFSDMLLTPFSASFPIASMIVQEQLLPSSTASTMNRYERLTIPGLGVLTQGIYVKGDVNDLNNDMSTFEKLFINGYTEAGILLQGANSFSNQILSCQLGGNSIAHYGVKSINGAGGESAHFAVYGGAFLGHTIADMYIQSRSAQPFIVDNLYSEGSNASLVADGVHGVATSIVLRGLRFASGVVNTDPIIKILNPGPVLIENCLLGTDFTKLAKIQWQYVPSNAPPSFRVVNTTVSGTANTLAGVFTSNKPTYLSDAFWRTGATVYGLLSLNPFLTLTYATGSGTSIAGIDTSTSWPDSRPIFAKVVATTNAQFGFANPTNLNAGQTIYYQIKNASGGALNAASPFADTLFHAAAYVAPGNGQNRTYGFFYDGAFLYQIRFDADVPN